MDKNFRNIGWILCILIPTVIFCRASATGVEWHLKVFATIFSVTILMWVFRLVPEFVACIFAVTVIVVLDVVPTRIALSGFASGSFFMAMSIFGLAALLVSSGLINRLALLLLHYGPHTHFWYAFALFFTGVVFTPVIPSANGRISIASPILLKMVNLLDCRPRDKGATLLSIAAFAGFSGFSTIFLTGKSVNFVIYGLLPTQVRENLTWLNWSIAAVVTAGVMILLCFIAAAVMFRGGYRSNAKEGQMHFELKEMGPLTIKEWVALGGMLAFLIGVLTMSIHKIDLPWIALFLLTILLVFEFLSRKEFERNLNWPFLIYIAGLVSLVKSMEYVGFSHLMERHMAWLGFFMKEQFLVFVLLLTLCIALIRIFVPNNATIGIFVMTLFPMAEANGINPWIVGFVVLVLSDGWIMPYQCTYYILFRDLTSQQQTYNENLFLRFNVVQYMIRLVAICASIYYWKFLGIL